MHEVEIRRSQWVTKKKMRSSFVLFTRRPLPGIARRYEEYRRHTLYTIYRKACRSDAVISRVFRTCSSAFSPASIRFLTFTLSPKSSLLPAIKSSRWVVSKEKLEKLACRSMCLSRMSDSARGISSAAARFYRHSRARAGIDEELKPFN